MTDKEKLQDKLEMTLRAYNAYLIILVVIIAATVVLFIFSSNDVRPILAAIFGGCFLFLPFLWGGRMDVIHAYYELNEVETVELYKLTKGTRRTLQGITKTSRGRKVAVLWRLALFIILTAGAVIIMSVTGSYTDIARRLYRWEYFISIGLIAMAVFTLNMLIREIIRDRKDTTDEQESPADH